MIKTINIESDGFFKMLKNDFIKKLFLLLIIITSCNTSVMPQPDQTITVTFPFELNRYLGTWYEIARFDHSFERGLQGVTATYSLKKDGNIEVLNQGYKHGFDKKPNKAVGKAKVKSSMTPRNLLVSFFWIFYAPYNIIELDDQYQYAMIGSNSSNYLWILSRTPKMDEITYNKLIDNAKSRGYDTSKLIKVIHPE